MTPLKAENRGLTQIEKILQPLIIFSATITLGYLFQMVAAFITDQIWGTSLVNIDDFNEMTPDELWTLRVSQIFYQIGTFLMTPLFFALIVKAKPMQAWSLDRPINTKFLPWVLLLLVLSVFSSSFLYEVLNFVNWPQEIIDTQESNENLLLQLLPANSLMVIVLNLLMFVILPAFLEEIYFRGMIQKVITNISGLPHFAIVLTSMLFAVVHGNLPGFLAYFVMGLVLGYLFYLTGNLKYSIIFHLLNNGLSLLLDWMYRSGNLSFDPNDSSVPVFPGVLTTLFILAIIYKLYKDTQKPKLKVALDQEPKVVWVKAYESQDLIHLQMICDRLNAEGYNAEVLNKRDSAYGHGYAEIHVPIHQIESAKSFIETLK
ncbi:MAG: CPBP family intramembrane metalloprotease [Bacteroidia bacterium]